MFRMPGNIPDEIQQSFPHCVTALFNQRDKFKASPRLISIEKDINRKGIDTEDIGMDMGMDDIDIARLTLTIESKTSSH
jgi:hypothetical protein